VTDYPYPFWRRGVFAAILILVIALALVPPLAKGTVNVRFFTISTPAPILHFYITINQLELHTAGLPSNIGWVTISWTDNFPKLDLAGQNVADPRLEALFARLLDEESTVPLEPSAAGASGAGR